MNLHHLRGAGLAAAAATLLAGCAALDEILAPPPSTPPISDGPVVTAPGQLSRVHVLPSGTELHFLEGDAARQQITNDSRENYFVHMQPLELQVKMRRAAREGETVEQLRDAFRALKRDSVLPWTDAEVAMLAAAFGELDAQAAATLPGLFPPVLEIIKTDGADESGAFYTTDRAIVLPEMRLARSARSGNAVPMLRGVLLHEAAHVWSRLNMRERDRLWATMGYKRVGPVDEGEFIRARRVSNPDAPTIDHALDLELPDGRRATVTQVLWMDVDAYSDDLPLFGALMRVDLAELEKNGPIWRVKHDDDGKPVLHAIEDVPAFLDAVSRNTGYMLHPEELASENIRLVVEGAPGEGERGAELLAAFKAAWPAK